MSKIKRLLGATLLAALLGTALAFEPYCHSAPIDWLAYLPVGGPIRSMEARMSTDPDDLYLSPAERGHLELLGTATFDEHGAMLSRLGANEDYYTYTNENGLRQTAHIIRSNGTQELYTVTYREFDQDGRPTEFALDLTTPTKRTRVVDEVTYGNNGYAHRRSTTYQPDGKSISTEERTLYNCTIETFTSTSATHETTHHFYYWNGDERVRPQSNEPFEIMRRIVYSQPVGANIPLQDQEQDHYQTDILERDHYGNPTIFAYARYEYEFDELVPVEGALVFVTYTYFD